MSVDQLKRPRTHPERYVVTTPCIALRDEPTQRHVGEGARHIGEDLDRGPITPTRQRSVMRSIGCGLHGRRIPQWR